MLWAGGSGTLTSGGLHAPAAPSPCASLIGAHPVLAAPAGAPGRASLVSYVALTSCVGFGVWLMTVVVALIIAAQLCWLLLAFMFMVALHTNSRCVCTGEHSTRGRWIACRPLRHGRRARRNQRGWTPPTALVVPPQATWPSPQHNRTGARTDVERAWITHSAPLPRPRGRSRRKSRNPRAAPSWRSPSQALGELCPVSCFDLGSFFGVFEAASPCLCSSPAQHAAHLDAAEATWQVGGWATPLAQTK